MVPSHQWSSLPRRSDTEELVRFDFLVLSANSTFQLRVRVGPSQGRQGASSLKYPHPEGSIAAPPTCGLPSSTGCAEGTGRQCC